VYKRVKKRGKKGDREAMFDRAPYADNPYKVYVEVTATFDTDGNITPVSFKWEDGRVFEIDRVVDVRQAASMKAGGTGIRYTCMVRGREVYLFFEEDRWFMERK
jgi:hypothetical protein